MKHKIYTIATLFILLSAIFSQSVFAQTAKKTAKVLTQDEMDKREVEKFIRSFIKVYHQTFDATKIPSTFFISDFKKQNTYSFYIDIHDKLLADDEKFRNGILLVDMGYAGFVSKLSDFNFDLDKLKKSFDNENAEENDENVYFSKKMTALFQKHQAAKIFLHKNDFSKITNIEEFRESVSDFHSLIKELRNSIGENEKAKLSDFFQKHPEMFINFNYTQPCSKDACGEFPDSAKMFYYHVFTIGLLIAKDKDKLKIINIVPTID
jgi:hypothetical protein